MNLMKVAMAAVGSMAESVSATTQIEVKSMGLLVRKEYDGLMVLRVDKNNEPLSVQMKEMISRTFAEGGVKESCVGIKKALTTVRETMISSGKKEIKGKPSDLVAEVLNLLLTEEVIGVSQLRGIIKTDKTRNCAMLKELLKRYKISRKNKKKSVNNNEQTNTQKNTDTNGNGKASFKLKKKFSK